ncbi:MAG TPA: tetratricopeptide repeat protein [Bryobacteraceae bacterium]|nr:tetratricopeptide repeat protein [Bryobacteraceae bacterium]
MSPEHPMGRRLDSWKEIAAYLNRTERTVHRWEEREGLPVHRQQHEKRSSVFAYTGELDAWREAREGGGALPANAELPASTAAHRWVWIATAAVLVACASFMAWRLAPRLPGSGGIQSVAVLPLENASRDPRQDYFVDGMTDELITELAKTRSLRVVSRSSVMRYKTATRPPVTQIARELGVDAVLEGEVLLSGDRVRITARLLDGRTDRHLWAETYDRDVRDVLTVQDEVARAITRQISGGVESARENNTGAGPTVSSDVREACMKARYHLHRGTEPEIRSAINEFQAALELNQRYAPAYAGLADCYVAFTEFYLPPSYSMPKARDAALHALQFDEKLPEAHTSLGVVRFLYEWDWKGAEQEFQRAVALNPNYVDAHLWYANFLAEMGRQPEAEAEIQQAERIDPLSLNVYLNATFVYYLGRREDRVARAFKTALELEPGFPITHSSVWLGYAPKVILDALVPLEKRVDPDPDNPMAMATLASYAAVEGRKDEARRLLVRLSRVADQRYVCPYEMAAAHAALQERPRAYHWLEQAYRQRSICLPDLKMDPRFDSLRGEPRFQGLLRLVGLAR